MATQLKTVYSELDRDLSPDWMVLSSKVRELSARLECDAAGTKLAIDAGLLVNHASLLCDHVERIHRDVGKLLGEIDDRISQVDPIPKGVDAAEVHREALQIHRETHELRGDFKDIIKALFMWQDDPVERAKNKK